MSAPTSEQVPLPVYPEERDAFVQQVYVRKIHLHLLVPICSLYEEGNRTRLIDSLRLMPPQASKPLLQGPAGLSSSCVASTHRTFTISPHFISSWGSCGPLGASWSRGHLNVTGHGLSMTFVFFQRLVYGIGRFAFALDVFWQISLQVFSTSRTLKGERCWNLQHRATVCSCRRPRSSC